MLHSSRVIAIVLLSAVFLSASNTLVLAQDARDKPKSTWPTESKSIVKKTTEGVAAITLSDEPVMRIALSTGTSAATISTTARLLNVSEIDTNNQPLETTRVRVESRMLTPSHVVNDRSYEMTLATSLSREDADRLSDSVRQDVGEQPQVVADSTDKWKVIIQKQSNAEIEETRVKLDDAGFEVVAVREAQKQPPNTAMAKSPLSTAAAASANKIKYTARAASPTRELVAFARGTAPSFRSSAPLIFASSMLILPWTISSYFVNNENSIVSTVATTIYNTFNAGTSPVYWLLYFIMVVSFTFFYALVIFQQQNIAENLQRQNGFIPGIRPGRPTAQYLSQVLIRITVAGALFLGIVAVLPYFVKTATGFQTLTISSTAVLIVVGVALDTMRQLEAQLIMRNYRGFIGR